MKRATHINLDGRNGCGAKNTFNSVSNINAVTCTRCAKIYNLRKILIDNRHKSSKEILELLPPGTKLTSLTDLRARLNLKRKITIVNFENEVWKTADVKGLTIEVSNYGRLKNLKTGELYKLTEKSKRFKRLYFSSRIGENSISAEVSKIVYQTFVDQNVDTPILFKDKNFKNLKVDNLYTITESKKIREAREWLEKYTKEDMKTIIGFSKLSGNSYSKLKYRALELKLYLKIPTNVNLSLYELCLKLIDNNSEVSFELQTDKVLRFKKDIKEWFKKYKKEDMCKITKFAKVSNESYNTLKKRAIEFKTYLKIPTSSIVSFYDLCCKMIGEEDIISQHKVF